MFVYSIIGKRSDSSLNVSSQGSDWGGSLWFLIHHVGTSGYEWKTLEIKKLGIL